MPIHWQNHEFLISPDRDGMTLQEFRKRESVNASAHLFNIPAIDCRLTGSVMSRLPHFFAVCQIVAGTCSEFRNTLLWDKLEPFFDCSLLMQNLYVARESKPAR
jgi:hypothetical protein